MFVLKKVNENRCLYLSEFGKEYTIGRKDCAIPITDDASISRKHAVIKNEDGAAKLKDCGSKYKTYRNGSQVKKEMGDITLQNGDEIQFGILKSKFIFQVVNVHTTGSRLSSEQNQKLTMLIKSLNGTFSDNWNDHCTHLTVQEIMLSLKVLHALIDEKPIVNLAFWESYVECIKNNLPPPSVNKFKPPMAEALLNSVSLEPDPSRKILFEGKVFVFVTEKGKAKMEEIITKAGGSCIAWQKNPLTIEDVKKSSYEYLIIQVPGEVLPAGLKELVDYFDKQGKRMIPIQEIAMAIVLCSCTKDCNPSFNRLKQVFKYEGTQDTQEKVHLAKETESEYFSASESNNVRPNMIISESLEPDIGFIIPSKNTVSDSHSPSNPFKRQPELSDSKDEIMIPAKRIKQEELSEINSESSNIPEDIPTQKIVMPVPSSSSSTTATNSMMASTSKRKADETPDTSAKKGKINPFATMQSRSEKKQSDNTLNPFTTLQKKVTTAVTKANKDNPFKKIQDTQSPKDNNKCIVIDDDEPSFVTQPKESSISNPFKNMAQKRKNETPSIMSKAKKAVKEIFSSTLNRDQVSDTARSIDISRIVNSTVSYIFLSKDKLRKDKNHNIKKELDPELEQFCTSFRDAVIVKEMTNYIKKESLTYEVEDSLDGTNNGAKNFKKFKKVKPLRPQNTIIAPSNLKRFGGAETNGSVVIADDSDDELQVRQKPKKRFNF